VITLLRHVVALMLLWACVPAAAITCSTITSPGVSINYVNNTAVWIQGTFTVTCTRAAGDPATSVTYGVVNDRGGSPSATNGVASLQYSLQSLGSCSPSDKWKGANGGGSTISDTMSLPSTGTFTKQTSFFVCVNFATATTAGLYSDTVTLTLTYPAGSFTGSFQVNIYAPAFCSFTTPPGNISLTYVALGPQVSGSTIFKVQCTTLMPYTLATDVPEYVLQNLRYILSLSSTAANGTGAPQPYTVTATIPAGQSGCGGGGCGATLKSHSVTISY
jgi:hypothetical protein